MRLLPLLPLSWPLPTPLQLLLELPRRLLPLPLVLLLALLPRLLLFLELLEHRHPLLLLVSHPRHLPLLLLVVAVAPVVQATLLCLPLSKLARVSARLRPTIAAKARRRVVCFEENNLLDGHTVQNLVRKVFLT